MDSVLTLPFPDDEFASELSNMDYCDINGLLGQSSQLCEQNYMSGHKQVPRENDFIDEFLNLTSVESPNPGIYVMPTTANTLQTEAVAIAAKKGVNAKLVQTDHDYSMKCCSPAPLSDSGVSSVSSSPKNETEYDKLTLDQDPPDPHLGHNEPFEFDFSDFEIEQINKGTFQALNDTSPLSVTLDLTDIGADPYENYRQKRYSGDCDSSSMHSGSSSDIYGTTSTTINMEASSTDTSASNLLPNFKPLVLTVEEKKLLKEEQVTIPTDLPLTKYEERVLKKVRRKIRNKKSAMASRQKKKDYVGGLEARVKKCTDLNEALSKRVKQLENQNSTLLEQLRQIHDVVKKNSSKTTQATTCVMVMILSFGLFIAPSYGPFSIDPNEDSLLNIPEGHRTRKILEHKAEENGFTVVEPLNSLIQPYNPALHPKSEVLQNDANKYFADPSIEVQHENDTAHNSSSRNLKDADVGSSSDQEAASVHRASPKLQAPQPSSQDTGTNNRVVKSEVDADQKPTLRKSSFVETQSNLSHRDEI
uniref:BZIP domain-containing protein n=1 Tax=Ciona savignyi TaxID=51511 RepID=H2Z934_CIOSA